MKKGFMVLVALLMVTAVAMPAFALDVKYGGLFRARLQSNDNLTDGNDNTNDNQNYLDQRLRMFFTFVSSENLQLVTGFEQDILWGDSRAKTLTGHRDTVGLELKHAYLDFGLPNTPMRSRVGLQPIRNLSGWILDEDFTGATIIGKFTPVTVTMGYVAERNNWVRSTDDNIDDYLLSVDFAQGPVTASFVALFQDAHDAGNFQTGTTVIPQPPPNPPIVIPTYLGTTVNDQLFDLGLAFQYKTTLFSAFVNYVQNLGSYTVAATGLEYDYRGFMVEGGGSFYCGPFTFSLGGFVTSGDDDNDDTDSYFRYPVGRSHYWSEIMGFGVLETTINGSGGTQLGGGSGASDINPNPGQYAAGDGPSNIWTVSAGAAWQIVPGTKLTTNYYYLATTKDVVSSSTVVLPPPPNPPVTVFTYDNSIGHEFDIYLDQTIVDKLTLTLVGAYLIADDAFTANSFDDDAYEIGARLMWAF